VCEVVCAFSRAKEEKKVYVQDRIMELSGDIFQVMDKQRAVFYVCGGAAMGKAVRECSRSVNHVGGGMNHEQSLACMKKLLNTNRYIAELRS